MKVEIYIGATVRVVRQSGAVEEYVFMGDDGSNTIFRDGHGETHHNVLAIPYSELVIKQPVG